MSRILHATDCLNAGVLRALEILTVENGNHEHYLLWDFHKDTPPPNLENLHKIGVTLIHWQGGYFQKVLMLRRLSRSLSPNFTHFHSSIAGFLGRLATNPERVLFSPHCFAFQRRDISPTLQFLHQVIELILSYRTDLYVVNWPVEAEIVNRNFRHRPVHFYPLINCRIADKFNEASVSNSIISIGRIRPQKDPEFFIDVVRLIGDRKGFNFNWIGGGDSDLEKLLSNEGVTISGWRNQNEIASIFQSSKLQLITSSWESGPFTFYEGLEHGIPSLLRNIEAFEEFNFRKCTTPIEMSNLVNELINDESLRRDFYRSQLNCIEKVFEKHLIRNVVDEIYKY